jgi:GTP cyclohydrolase I
MNRKQMQKAVQLFLDAINERFPGDDLKRTPARVTRAWCDEFLDGYQCDPVKLLSPKGRSRKKKRPEGKSATIRDIILAQDIFFYSICVHHLLPFLGRAHIAYIPGGRIVGFSKMARVLDAYARRLQIQERLTRQVAEALYDSLEPMGVAVLLEAEHLCMKLRGVRKTESSIITTCFIGCFQESVKLKHSFMNMVFRKKNSRKKHSSII